MATVKKSKKKIIIPICIVLVIAIVVTSVVVYGQVNSSETVSLYTIGTDDIYETVSATGEVSAGAVKEYKVNTVATVKEIFVSVGDKVKKGDVLATFETDMLEEQISSLQSSYNKTKNTYEEAKASSEAAQKKADQLSKEIAVLENEIAQLKKSSSVTQTGTGIKKNSVAVTPLQYSGGGSSDNLQLAAGETYTVSVSTFLNNGTVSGGGTYTSGETATVIAVPNEGYEFSGWYTGISLVSEDATYSFTVTQNITLRALFTVRSSTEPSTNSDNTTRSDSANSASGSIVEQISGQIQTISDAITQLTNTLAQITEDVETMSTMSQVIAQAVAEALSSGMFDSDQIADYVASALADALESGIIDAANLMVESDMAKEMITSAVSQIDFAAITSSVMNSKNVTLTSKEVQLASLYAQYEIYSLKADSTLTNTEKEVLNTTADAIEILKEQQNEMQSGWTADFDGTITSCDLTAGGQTTLISSAITLENTDSMIATISLGEYDIHKIKMGMACTITTAYGIYSGQVTTIAPTATGDSSSSLLDSVGSMAGISGLSSLTASGAGVECTVSIDNPDENIIIGFDADVEIQTGEYLGVTVVPIESIVLEKTGTYVYLYNAEEETVTKTQIETGAVSDSYYQVTDGLDPGDQIISAPSSNYDEDTFSVKVSNS